MGIIDVFMCYVS